MEKINVAEILRNCPKGMELDCYLFNGLEFRHIDTDNENYPIVCRAKDSKGEYYTHTFTKYGWYTSSYDYAKCVIFPKGKTTWEGFVPPCQFKDGDIVATDNGRWVGIIKNKYDFEYYTVHCAIDYTFNDIFYRCGEYRFSRLATEEEKAQLFQVIKDNGYKWNSETKTLEKFPKFKVGDRVKHISAYTSGIVVKVTDKGYHIDYPKGEGVCYVSFTLEKDYELASNKFNINTLRPFDKVLMRSSNAREWVATFYSHYSNNKFYGCGMCCDQCIPYEGNEHLLGTTDDCDEYFKTWK